MATNKITIEVDYGKSVARIGELELTFKQLEQAATKSRNAIKKAVRDTETSLAGTVKALTRERAALVESQSTLARNNDEYRKFQRQIDLVSKQIERLTDTRKREGVTLKNSANGIRAQIAAIREEMDNRKLSNKQYQLMQNEITALEGRLASLTNVITAPAGTIAAFDQQIAALQREQREVATTKERIEELEQQITSLKMRKAELAGGTRDASKAMQGMSSSAGASGAVVTEFGRTIGDAPFGLMGMANNLQQLSQQFVDLQAKSGGTRQALQSIMKTIIGPAGFVVAVNIITAAITAYTMRKEKARKETQKFSNELVLQGNILKALRTDYLNGNNTLEERTKILNTLAITDKNLQEILKDQALTEDERNEKAKNYIETITLVEQEESRLAKLKEDIDKDGRTLDELRIERAEKEAEMIALKTTLERDGSATARLGAALEIKIREQQLVGLDEQIGKYDTITQQTLDLANLRKSIEVEDKKIDNDRLDALDDLAQATFDLRQRILDKELSDLEESEVQTVEARRKVITKIFGLEMERLEAQRQKELENITDQATINAINEKFEKLSEIAAIDFREQLEGAIFEPLEVEVKPKLSLKELLDGPEKTEAQEWAAKELAKSLEGIDAELAKRVETTGKRNPFVDRFGVSEEDVLLAIDTLQQGFQAINDVLTAQAEKEIAVETNKTNALNDELRRRLANEKLSADQRDQINQQIARNQAALVEKENAIKKKRFKQQKAFNIAMAVIDTYVAANQALKDETLVSTFAKVAAMVSIIGTGLANVASISKQEFTGKPLPAANLSSQGGGTAIAAPSFNVVGQSTRNQIADAVSSALSDQVLKAYVVSSDVTTAQELDRKIVEGASI